MLSSWVVGQQLRHANYTASRFSSTLGETYYLFIPGVAGGSKKKGQEGRVEVTDVWPSNWSPGHRPNSDPSFKFKVDCRLLTEQDLGKLQLVSYQEGVFPATISYQGRGKVIHAVVLGEAKLRMEVLNNNLGLTSSPWALWLLRFEARRMRITAP